MKYGQRVFIVWKDLQPSCQVASAKGLFFCTEFVISSLQVQKANLDGLQELAHHMLWEFFLLISQDLPNTSLVLPRCSLYDATHTEPLIVPKASLVFNLRMCLCV